MAPMRSESFLQTTAKRDLQAHPGQPVVLVETVILKPSRVQHDGRHGANFDACAPAIDLRVAPIPLIPVVATDELHVAIPVDSRHQQRQLQIPAFQWLLEQLEGPLRGGRGGAPGGLLDYILHGVVAAGERVVNEGFRRRLRAPLGLNHGASADGLVITERNVIVRPSFKVACARLDTDAHLPEIVVV